MDATIRLSMRLGLSFAQFSLLTPYPGTPIFESLRSQGLLLTEDYDRFTVVDPVIDYDKIWVSRRAVSRKLFLAYLPFYTRPSCILRHPRLLSVIPRAIFPRHERWQNGHDTGATCRRCERTSGAFIGWARHAFWRSVRP